MDLRRNLFKVTAMYIVAGWIVIHTYVLPVLLLSVYLPGAVIIMVLIRSPLAELLAWTIEVTPDGMQRTKANATDKAFSMFKKALHLIHGTKYYHNHFNYLESLTEIYTSFGDDKYAIMLFRRLFGTKSTGDPITNCLLLYSPTFKPIRKDHRSLTHEA